MTTKAKTKAAKTETSGFKATELLRKGALAYVGLYGAAYDRAQLRISQARQATDGLFDTLVAKGEEIETSAGVVYKDTRSKVCLLYTSPSPRDATLSRMPSSA